MLNSSLSKIIMTIKRIPSKFSSLISYYFSFSKEKEGSMRRDLGENKENFI
jgi:hypothetical protein